MICDVITGVKFGLVFVCLFVFCLFVCFFFFKQKTAYEIGTGDWSSDVCSSDLAELRAWVRRYLLKAGQFRAQIDAKIPAGSTKFELYRAYDVAVNKVAPHNLLALLRGQIGRASCRERV